MANITSVRDFEERRNPAILGVAVLVACPSLLCVSMCKIGTDSWFFGFILGSMALAMLGWYFMQKTKYWVRIGTAGAEANATWSKDKNWTMGVVAAINEAIVRRG
jgi:hypothetical protein